MSILVANFVLVFDLDRISKAVEFVGEIGERERKRKWVFISCLALWTLLFFLEFIAGIVVFASDE